MAMSKVTTSDSEQNSDSLKCVKWLTEFENDSGGSEAKFHLTHFVNSVSRYSVACTYDKIKRSPVGKECHLHESYDVEICLQELKSNDEESTSRKDSETVSDYYQQPCDVWIIDNKNEKHQLIKMPDSDYWKSEVFSVGIQTIYSLSIPPIKFEIWIKFPFFGVSEIKALQSLSDYLFVDQTNCDVQFSFEDGRHIGAHKKILSVRSPVFAAMFKHDMLEEKTEQVAIKEIDLDIFKELIHFIYYGRISELLNQIKARPLLLAADIYGISDLKEDCSRKLISSIGLQNAISLMIWAHANSVEQVKEAALDVVVRNGKKICLQDEWETLTLLHPDLCLLATRRIMEIAEFPPIKMRKANTYFL